MTSVGKKASVKHASEQLILYSINKLLLLLLLRFCGFFSNVFLFNILNHPTTKNVKYYVSHANKTTRLNENKAIKPSRRNIHIHMNQSKMFFFRLMINLFRWLHKCVISMLRIFLFLIRTLEFIGDLPLCVCILGEKNLKF